ncbi:MAG TPA: Crp/Fnr family transcriptional regulator [Blastocatellia bacterium]|nr:Crp/Fnr family transcriptional regulator [Blastocatellia bacterium]
MNVNGKAATPVSNRLLTGSLLSDPEHLHGGLEPVTLEPGEVLCHSGEEIHYVYFPNNGLISLVATMMDGTTVETGIVGREGMIGVPVLLGAGSAPYRAIVQVAGSAWRMRTEAFRNELHHNPAFHSRLLLYTEALMIQMSQMAACNCLHSVEERLCSLLLMVHDRTDGGQFCLTHEAIADMLGTRRAGVTVAAGKLRQAGVISYVRGHIHILDRYSLETEACECYHTVRAEFSRLLEAEPPREFSPLHQAIQWNGSGVSAGLNQGRESIRVT